MPQGLVVGFGLGLDDLCKIKSNQIPPLPHHLRHRRRLSSRCCDCRLLQPPSPPRHHRLRHRRASARAVSCRLLPHPSPPYCHRLCHHHRVSSRFHGCRLSHLPRHVPAASTPWPPHLSARRRHPHPPLPLHSQPPSVCFRHAAASTPPPPHLLARRRHPHPPFPPDSPPPSVFLSTPPPPPLHSRCTSQPATDTHVSLTHSTAHPPPAVFLNTLPPPPLHSRPPFRPAVPLH